MRLDRRERRIGTSESAGEACGCGAVAVRFHNGSCEQDTLFDRENQSCQPVHRSCGSRLPPGGRSRRGRSLVARVRREACQTETSPSRCSGGRTGLLGGASCLHEPQSDRTATAYSGRSGERKHLELMESLPHTSHTETAPPPLPQPRTSPANCTPRSGPFARSARPLATSLQGLASSPAPATAGRHLI
jgi:hypothetical protein